MGPRVHDAPGWGPIRSVMVLAPLFFALTFGALYQQFTLPTPNVHPYDPQTGLPHPSEAMILSYAKYLSEDIGYRTPGTREHAEADVWMVRKAEEIKQLCEEAVNRDSGRKLECEVWRQEGSGSHRFDMMNKRLYKTYVNLSNVIVRISDGTVRGKSSAVLINAHLDSTLPSPGAADDALAVGVLLECARVLVETPGWEPTYAIIFLFNNAEESLQDGSHLFSTQHTIAPTVRAVVNLEAAGTAGRDLLFQATSEEMIEAYSHVPRPYGTIYANEIFSSGILLSDTDFRQFEHYLNVTGLDMAVVGNSYMYHMRGDLVENIQPGVAQHMAENSLALLRFLSSDVSPVPRLEHGFSRPRTVFFSTLGLFLTYSFTAAKVMYVALFGASFYLVWTTGIKRVWTALGAVVLALIGALIGANGMAFVMTNVLHKGMSWFRAEYFPVALYGPAAAVGVLISQVPFSKARSNTTLEKPILAALLLFQSGLAAVVQLFNIGSSAAPFLGSVGMFVALGFDAWLLRSRRTAHVERTSKQNGANGVSKAIARRVFDATAPSEVSLWTYAIMMLVPLVMGTQLLAATLVVFVPLTGRLGKDAPGEFIIASIVAVLGSFVTSFGVAFVHRFGPATLRRTLVFALLVLGVAMAFFYNQVPFDETHQKRLFVVHMEDLITREQHLQIAAADGAPGFSALVHSVADEFGVDGVLPKAIVMDDYNNDWDTLYPFSAFLSPYKIDLPLGPTHVEPSPPEEPFTVTAVNDTIDKQAGTRTLTLKIEHPGIIWTVIVFDAYVLDWTLDDHPPSEFARHHIKEASFYGTDTWTVTMTLKIGDEVKGRRGRATEGLKIDFVGIREKRMWPAKRAESDGSQAMALFEALDGWFEERTGGRVDAMFMGCVRGETII